LKVVSPQFSFRMISIAHLIAVLILISRIYVPISMTVLGSWPVRFLLFFLWYHLIVRAGGGKLRQFYRILRGRRAEMRWYTIWLLLLLLFVVVQSGEHSFTNGLLTAYIGTIPFYLLGSYYWINGGNKQNITMALMVVVVVGISSLQAIPVIWKNPHIVRVGLITANAEIRSLGIGSYGDFTGFAIVLPFLITTSLSLQNKPFFRILGAASCFLILVLMMISTLSGVLLLTAMALTSCTLYYMILGGVRFNRILSVLVGILGIYLVAVQVFPSIYERKEFGFFYDKLRNTILFAPEIVAGQEKDPTYRYGLMIRSLNLFLENPVLGVGILPNEGGMPRTGGHSSWMDVFANYGLFGGIPYLLFHLLILRRLWKAWRSKRQNALSWGCLTSCVFYIFYGFFNVTTQSTTIALFLYVTSACWQKPKALANDQPFLICRRANSWYKQKKDTIS